MATLVLARMFVNLLPGGQAVSGVTAPGRNRVKESKGEIRVYAGGRTRSVTSEGVTGTYSFTMLLLPMASVETLESWIGHTVQVRDNRGQRHFGVYYKVPTAEVRGRTTYNVAIDLNLVSQAEGV